MINVEWDSSVIKHGRYRGRMKSSTVHGWLVKMRGTLIGDERMRAKGIEEMKSASRHRKRNASGSSPRPGSGSRKKPSGGGIFASLFGSTTKRSSRHGGSKHGGKSRHAEAQTPRRAQTMPVSRNDNRPTPSRRPSGQSRKPSGHSHRPGGQSRRPSRQGSRQQARRANTR